MILVLVTSILWSLTLAANIFPEFADKSLTVNSSNIFKKAILILLGLTISGLIITWLVYNLQNLSSESGIISFILNTLLILIILGLIYKTFFVKIPNEKSNAKKNAFFNLIINIIFYIPCLFTNLFDFIMNLVSKSSSKSNMDISTARDFYILFFTILLIVGYIAFPYIYKIINLQGGKLLVNKPVYTNILYSLGTYEELNESSVFDYQYAISFWLFLDAFPPNSNSSHNQYTSLLNFGEKPNVLYNASDNTLIVTMQDGKDSESNHFNDIERDDKGNIIVYKKEEILLQKWNNIIINYTGGTLDIFFNGELAKSIVGIVPYYTLDNLTIGEQNGNTGGICNVVYFNKSLTINNIFYLYNMVKDKTPPITSESNITIVKSTATTPATTSTSTAPTRPIFSAATTRAEMGN
jgi:hypothetical protein